MLILAVLAITPVNGQLSTGEYNEVLGIVRDRLDPPSAEEWFLRGGTFANQGAHETSLECYEKAIQLNSSRPEFWNEAGISLSNLGRDDEALIYFEVALQLDPKFKYAWNNKGNVFLRWGKYDEAIRCFDEGLRIDPSNGILAMNRKIAISRKEEAKRKLSIQPGIGGSIRIPAWYIDEMGNKGEPIRLY